MQVVVGDLLNIEDVLRAAQGVDYMFFTFAVQGGLLEASTIAAIAARDAGKRHSVHHYLFRNLKYQRMDYLCSRIPSSQCQP